MAPTVAAAAAANTNIENTNHEQQQQQQNESKNNSDKFIVRYRQQRYDLTKFIHKHPGGINTLKGLNNADMTSRFMKAPPHSDAAMYLLKEYKLNENSTKNEKPSFNGGVAGTLKNKPQAVHDVIESQENGVQLIEDTNNNHLDESMEHLVDWSKPMLPQIAGIAKHYNEWVHKPVDRQLRLLGPWYLEICTKTPWWVVPSFWIPVIVKLTGNAFQENLAYDGQLILLVAYFCIGILLWTFIEYSLHRWVFHIKISMNSSPWLCTFHFLLHGLHHKVPFDSYRLVFPPLPGVILATIIYSPIHFIFPQPRILLSGGLFGYLCYDMIHYYLHYGDPNCKHLYDMKRYHYQHHFAHQELGYGISSPIWDFVFQTRIHLRKLRYKLRWS